MFNGGIRQAGKTPEQGVVIGGGISGLATAGLLARDGHAVTLLEKQQSLGGRAGRWQRDGFTFDTGPSWYLMPEVIDHWFKMMGTSAAAELELTRLDPAYKLFSAPPARAVDVRTGRAEAIALFESQQQGSGSQLAKYLDSAELAYTLAKRHFLYDPFGTLRGLVQPAVLRHAPKLLQLLTQSLDRFAARRFSNPLQQKILGYPAVFLGTSPDKAPSIYHLMSHLDLQDGVLYPHGGFIAVVDAMERVVRRAGVRIVTGATATKIVTGPAGTESRCEAVAWHDDDGLEHRLPARLVVGAADLHHIETQLLPEQQRTMPERKWRKADPGISAVLLCLGVRGGLPQLAHHNLLFTEDWQDNFARIIKGRTLADTTSLYVSRPSATDSTVAPDGCENLFVLIPAPALPQWGKGGYDGGGSAQVEQVADAAIAQLALWSGTPDLAERIVVRRSYGPADFQADVNAWQGSALGLAHTLRQSAFLRPGNVNHKVDGLYYAGSSVRPGIGVPLCMISAELVLKSVRGDQSSGPLPEPLAAEAPATKGSSTQSPLATRVAVAKRVATDASGSAGTAHTSASEAASK
ncbi:phytoene desaturase family protein [Arthrobacter sp. H35-D1]|uniref:phytoene desaturase family protein n=1 Tax=Arthrobacter sp. H35-D1 TaxID=3046202 RepID=UPI0024B8E089|nr:phytoene desaturase family protein [Arthrobacter sp. H35-D1]MDJ0314972.1 phytoene desaturase family protein [Arthrobacter sp. H35-D1]